MSRIASVLLIFPLLVTAAAAAPKPGDDALVRIERDLESSRYTQLAGIQAAHPDKLVAFTSDGCSGGLSDGWRFLAQALPPFKHKFGGKPPYEACCVVHDRYYWRGETEQGFDKRLQADQRLRQCVVRYGSEHRNEFAQEFHLSPEAIDRNFQIVAALMYRAVRVGGMPCTPFAWRWGYGWPPCKADAE